MIKNIFITGKPGCGKTTLLREIVKGLEFPAGGFYTQEIRENGKRKGFKIISLDGKEGILAHTDIESSYKVSKYKVNLKDLEKVGVESILRSLGKSKVIVIDEIGKMELFSEKFKEAVAKALEAKNKVLGTITLAKLSFVEEIKKRRDTKIFYLTKENKEKIKEEILKIL